MDPSVLQYLEKNESLLFFVRYHPIWYRYLSRDPDRIQELEKEAKKFYGKTFSQRIEQFGNNIQMLSMMMQFAGALKD